MKTAKAERRRRYEEAIPKLEARGFALVLQPSSLCLQATSPCGRTFIIYPTTRSWMEKGLKKGTPARRSGSVDDFLHDFTRTSAARANDAAEWARLKPELTIFTDAALCPRSGASGWGAWMKGGGEASITVGGQISDLLFSSSEAEARAGANAFAVAKGRGLLKPGSVVMWQSDSLTALRWLLGSYPLSRDRPAKDGISAGKPKGLSATAKASPGATELARICKELKLRVFVRHVKGHQGGPNRQWVNRRCDEVAGEHMRMRRQLIENPQAQTAAIERAAT